MKRVVIFMMLSLSLSCSKPKIVYNDYSFIEKIDRKFFTKGETVSPENRLELYIIERENSKLVKKTLVNREKEDKDIKDRHSFLLNYNNDKLYLLFYKNVDIGAESRKAKIFYYDKDFNLKPFNDYEYVFDNIDEYKNINKGGKKVKNVDTINYVIENNVYYNISNEGGFKNNERIIKEENYIFDFNKQKKELYLSPNREKEESIYIYNFKNGKIRKKKISDDDSKCFFNSCLKLDDENVIYSKGNLLIKRNFKTKKEKILYKAHNEIKGIKSLNKENTLITFGVSNNASNISLILGYINKWKWDHDVVYDLKENKIYMLETGNDNLVDKEEQLRLISEIIDYGLEKD
ncbi:hypothetical protein [Pseudoleptotrichia goodfellowii]|uniref:Lipoprotein n=2 Tax=Pseudoleptotrichia goodfellowii TaxID=157692 RepID=A0A510JCG9_9FUSO|nr:hypothetical protein [Pseudoleptotrichia goodfellowii]BBM36904.1 hypothetical protein JCM16774_1850 [Pseudoleptotrichia goodfellowii]